MSVAHDEDAEIVSMFREYVDAAADKDVTEDQAEVVNDEEPVTPADLDDDELYEEIFNKPGLTLLRDIPLLARGYQRGSPRGVLMRAILVSALSEPNTIIYTGMDQTPLNFQIGFVGQSGRGKGRAMGAPIEPVNNALWEKDTPASGEKLIDLFFEKVEEPNDDGKGTRTVAVRHNRGVWIEWAEVDAFAAKAGKANGTRSGGGSNMTLDSYIRQLITGEVVGDRSLTRDRQAVGSRLEAMSYRFAVTFGVQPERAHPLVADGGGGTLQRTLWVKTIDEDMPRKAPEIRAVRAQLARNLGLPTVPDIAPTLFVAGPSKVEVTPDIQDRILEDSATILSGSDEIAAEDTHMNLIAIRLAAIFAGWVSWEMKSNGMPFVGNCQPNVTAVVDAAAWWWAQCLIEMSKRDRTAIYQAGTAALQKESEDAGVRDGIRAVAREHRILAEQDAEARKTLNRIVEYLEKNGPQYESKIKSFGMSGNQKKSYSAAVDLGLDEGLLRSERVTTNGRTGVVLHLDRDID